MPAFQLDKVLSYWNLSVWWLSKCAVDSGGRLTWDPKSGWDNLDRYLYCCPKWQRCMPNGTSRTSPWLPKYINHCLRESVESTVSSMRLRWDKKNRTVLQSYTGTRRRPIVHGMLWELAHWEIEQHSAIWTLCPAFIQTLLNWTESRTQDLAQLPQHWETGISVLLICWTVGSVMSNLNEQDRMELYIASPERVYRAGFVWE